MDAAVRRAEQLIELGRGEEAYRLLTGVVGAAPDDAEALCQLARAALACGRVPDAVRAGERACALLPDDEFAHRLLAVAYSDHGDVLRARTAARRAVELDPADAAAHFTLASVLRRHGLDGALEPARAAVRLAPEDADSHELLGDVLLDAGENDAAGAAYERALALHPGHAGALHGLALVAGRGRRFGRAATALHDSLAADPRYTDPVRDLIALADLVVGPVDFALALVLVVALLRDDRLSLAVALGAAVLVIVLVAALVSWRTRPHTRRIVRTVYRRDRMLRWLVWSHAVGLVAVAAAVATPDSARPVPIGVAFVALLAGVFVQEHRGRDETRARREQTG